jgi:polysaccharide export outer membrane protein
MKILLALSMFFFSACSVKEYKLFQEEKSKLNKEVDFETSSKTQEINITYASKIMPNDILKIDIYNMNKKSNIMMGEKGGSYTPENKYIVYTDGTILLPLLNSVKVQGFTIKELNQFLTNRYKDFLKIPYVKASVENRKVYILGEVTKQGAISMDGETISVIEVIAKAGGLTDYAIRNKIRIISKENGKHILRTLNLNKFSTLNSENLLLKNNSIVYIEPKSTKAVRVTINDYLPIIQAMSSVLSTFLTVEILKNQ